MPNRSAQPISSCGPCQFEWPRRPDWPKRDAVRAAESTAWLQRTNSHGSRTHHSQSFRAAHTESNLCVLAGCHHPLHCPVMQCALAHTGCIVLVQPGTRMSTITAAAAARERLQRHDSPPARTELNLVGGRSCLRIATTGDGGERYGELAVPLL
ncbi:hypothetical protein GGI43DRAFT_373190 [Trichoderma evansii]